MKSRLQDFYDYVLGDLADVNKQLKKQEELKAARIAEFKKKSETKAFFQKPTTKVREAKTIEQKQKEEEEKIRSYFANLITAYNQIEFNKILKSIKSIHLEKILSAVLDTKDSPQTHVSYQEEDLQPLHEPEEKNFFHEEEPPPLWEPETKTENLQHHVDQNDLEQIELGGGINLPPELELKPQMAGNFSYNQFSMPSDQEITQYFTDLESKHHFFDELKSDLALEKYKAFFKVCRVIGHSIENTTDLADISAQAYKMLVLFGDQDKPEDYFKSFDDYLKKHNIFRLEERPLHDSLNWPIPVNGVPRRIDLAKWRKLIHDEGPKAFQLLFNRAPEIEDRLKRPPKNYEEGYKTSKQLAYTKENIFPELADLCMQYGLSNKLFERCLLFEEKKKTSDNLPNITIDGSAVGKEYKGYHLTKLPISDPRAYLLGYITNCCQSVGGHSERCVLDGIAQVNNGFYVLLKEKTLEVDKKLEVKEVKGDHKEQKDRKDQKDAKKEVKETKQIQMKHPVKEGKIDYENFKIVGQGYAWLSQEGNLVFDSWENLRPEGNKSKRDDAVIVPLLQEFASQVVTDKHSSILRVTIGTGGKTPKEYESKEVRYPEKILQGKQYGDSSRQGLVYYNQEKQNALYKTICDELNSLLDMKSEETKTDLNFIDEILPKEFISSIKKSDSLNTLIKDEVFKNFLRDKSNREPFIQCIKRSPFHGWNMLSRLKEVKGLSSASLSMLIQSPEHFLKKIVAVINLNQAKVLDEKSQIDNVIITKITDSLNHYPAHAADMSIAYINLFQSGFFEEKTHNKETLQYIKSVLDLVEANPADALTISQAVSNLHKEKFLSGSVFAEISRNISKASELANIHIQLCKNSKLVDMLSKINLFTTQNKLLIASHGEHYFSNIIESLQKLAEINRLDEFIFNKIVTFPQHTSAIASAVKCLEEAKLYNQYGRVILERNDSAHLAAQALVILLESKIPNSEYYIKVITELEEKKQAGKMPNFHDFFSSHTADEKYFSIKSVLKSIIALHNEGIFSKDTFEMISSIENHSENMAQTCIELHREKLLSKQNLNDIQHYILNTDYLYTDNKSSNKFNPDVYVIPLCKGWIALNKLGIHNKENFEVIKKIIEISRNDARTIITELLENINKRPEDISQLNLSDHQKMLVSAIEKNPTFRKMSLFGNVESTPQEEYKRETKFRGG